MTSLARNLIEHQSAVVKGGMQEAEKRSVQAHLRLCNPQLAGERPPSPPLQHAKSALSEYLARASATAVGEVPAVAMEQPQQLDVIMEDLEVEEGLQLRGMSPPPRGCSPDLSRPFFFHARWGIAAQPRLVRIDPDDRRVAVAMLGVDAAPIRDRRDDLLRARLVERQPRILTREDPHSARSTFRTTVCSMATERGIHSAVAAKVGIDSRCPGSRDRSRQSQWIGEGWWRH